MKALKSKVWPALHNAKDLADASEFAAIIEDHLLFGILSRAEYREQAIVAVHRFRERTGLTTDLARARAKPPRRRGKVRS